MIYISILKNIIRFGIMDSFLINYIHNDDKNLFDMSRLIIMDIKHRQISQCRFFFNDCYHCV